MKKKISILTATRAEYGLLRPIIIKLSDAEAIDVRVVVTGAHLSSEFGLTYREIEKDGIVIDEKIEILLSSDTPTAISKTMGLAMISFADYFERLMPDMLIVLGDRYETLAVVIAAMNCRIPIAHLYGGETTEGAIDEAIRHAITKMSYLHFTSTEEYRQRVIQLGENPERVFCVGAMGVENIIEQKLLSKSELGKELGFSLDVDYAMVTFHPVTLENESSREQMQALLDACESYRHMLFVFTKTNADAGGRIINKMIDDFVAKNSNAIAFSSLGSMKYLSALKYSRLVIGNSSSGIIEAPSFGIPIVNIGDRQKGRIQADCIINCEPVAYDIKRAIGAALSEEFRIKAQNAVNPYGSGNTSEAIARRVKDFFVDESVNLKKRFFDCGVK